MGFNMDTACVELTQPDSTKIAIYTPAIEDAFARNNNHRSELDWLIYNDPDAYADLVLNGDVAEYLKHAEEFKLD